MKILTTKEEKTAALLRGVMEHFPQAREIDLQKRTPLGEKIWQAFDQCARKIAFETKDNDFLKIAREFKQAMSFNKKPAPQFQYK